MFSRIDFQRNQTSNQFELNLFAAPGNDLSILTFGPNLEFDFIICYRARQGFYRLNFKMLLNHFFFIRFSRLYKIQIKKSKLNEKGFVEISMELYNYHIRAASS